MLKYILMTYYGPDSSRSGKVQFLGCCERGNESSGSLKCGELLEKMRNYHLVQKEFSNCKYVW
jgi:hypothetical protein